ncbi:unnamed protein product [Ectocarpus fasciculatus]
MDTWRRFTNCSDLESRIPKGRAIAPGRRCRRDIHLQLPWRESQIAPLPMHPQHPQQVLSRPTRYRGAAEPAGGRPSLVVASGGDSCGLLALVEQHSLHSSRCRGGGSRLWNVE